MKLNKILQLLIGGIVAVIPIISEAQIAADPNLGLSQVLPASPNAASLGAFGDVPVDYSSGLPNISIPLFDYGQGPLKSAVTLNYHGGGLKVSEVASWVGAGWSLNAGGVITRSVRGIADEYYFYDPLAMKVQYMIDHVDDPDYNTRRNVRNKLISAGKGEYADTEPDIFYFNFGGVSGKFYYSQADSRFHTISKSNLVITYTDNTGFTIKDEAGNTFYFNEKESTSTSQTCLDGAGPISPSSTSAWYLTRVEKPGGMDFITYEYNNNAFSSFTIPSTQVSYLLQSTDGGANSSTDGLQLPNDQFCMSTINVGSKKLSKINFRDGYLLFHTNTSRCDLIGEKALDDIELYDLTGNLKKRMTFSYGYLGGSDFPASCNDPDQGSYMRLKLKNVREEIVVNGSVIQHNPYLFEYENENDAFPSLKSFAQDYWGYYNGKTSNTSLIPDVIHGGVIVFPSGNNLNADPDFTKFGVLKKITYPTKGSSEYVYENNQAADVYIPVTPPLHAEDLLGDQTGAQSYYEKTFTINNNAGGANVNIYYTSIGCTMTYNDYYDYPLSRCADLKIVGQSTGAPSVDVLPNYQPDVNNTAAVNLPNGTYKMIATFNQPSLDFKNFIFEVAWAQDNSQPTQHISTTVGGLRIRSITDYDGLDHQHDKKRYFDYKLPDGTCSGFTIGAWSNAYDTPYDIYYYNTYTPPPPLPQSSSLKVFHYLKRSSVCNYPLLSSGNNLQYAYVTVHNGLNDENGKTEVAYSVAEDDVLGVFPYPYVPRDWQRGQLQDQKDYKTTPTGAELVSSLHNDYVSSSITDLNETKAQPGLKLGFIKSVQFDGNSFSQAGFSAEELTDLALPVSANYQLISGWSKNTFTETAVYSNGSSAATQIHKTYDLANLQLNQSNGENSLKQQVATKITYSTDFNFASAPVWLQNLQQNNNVTLPIERIETKIIDGTNYVTNAVLTTYKAGQPLPDEVFELSIKQPVLLSLFIPVYVSGGNLIHDSRYVQQMSFNYNDIGNIIEQKKVANPTIAYKWGYQQTYPTAQCQNSLSDEFFTENFEEMSGAVAGGAHTGHNYYSGSYTTSDKLAPGYHGKSYIISYWYKDGSGVWTYSGVLAYSGQTLSGAIDDIHIYPSDAQITTYTYDPIVGMTSMIDTKGMTSYYEYDSFNRLRMIKDQNSHILKAFCYNYKGEATNCLVPQNNPPQNNPPPTIYARLEITNAQPGQYDYDSGIDGESSETEDFYIRFYTDASCTIPLSSPTNTTVNIAEMYSTSDSMSGYHVYPYTNVFNVPANSTEYYIGNLSTYDDSYAITYYSNYQYWNYSWDYSLDTGNYVIEPTIYY